MKHFFKVYFIALLIIVVGGTTVAFGYMLFNRDAVVFPSIGELGEIITDSVDKDLTPLEKALKNSSIINVLVVGKEHVRTDTIMLASYDKTNKKASILSIPRDTYYEREGYEGRFQKKINAIYQDEGIEGLLEAVRNITGMPVDKWATIDYNGVVKVVDILGGIEVDIPFYMDYDDPYDDPPLVIDFAPGAQTLDGQQAIKYLRFRKNNDGTGYANGDLDRIKAQQGFVKEVVRKSLSLKLPEVIGASFEHIQTNFTLTEILGLVPSAVGFDMANINAETMDCYLKEIDNLQYVVPNQEGIANYVKKLYNVEGSFE